MLLLTCSGLVRGFDEGPLFQNIGFELYGGERVGLVGPNGVGKTTLLRLLAGLDQPDDGEVRLHAGARAALLRQQPEYDVGRSLFEEARTALDELLAAHDDMIRTAEALAAASDETERRALAARYERLNDLLRHHDAYNVDHRVERILDGLGFRAADYDRPVETFSGGQQSRLMLAKLLLAAPDVLLLDEPSNHLDIDATNWLEQYLADQDEAMIIVSHDRYFLDRVVTKIFELHAGQLAEYPGNYQAYWRLRRERYEQEVNAWRNQQDYIARQEEYIRRVHYGQLHKQAQSRQKALDRLARVERPKFIETPRMHFGEVRRTGDVVFQVDELAKAYDRPLFSNLGFTLERGRRLGILGPNGSGKTTLLRILMGEGKPDAGQVQRGHRVEFGYYDQHLQMLPTDQPVIQAVWPDTEERGGETDNGRRGERPGGDSLAIHSSPTNLTEQQMRDLLGRFGLVGDQVYQRVGDLSGGERSRAALARLVAQGVNVLILDEPTNHLDLWACDALEQALLEFEGTLIVVSHDRYFLNRVADLLIVLDGAGRAHVIQGNYDTYERMRMVQESGDSNAPPAKQTKVRDKQAIADQAKAAAGAKRKRRFPYRKLEELEADIARAEARQRELEQLLASPDLYRDGDKVKQTTRDFEEIKTRLKQLYEHWEEAVELS
jgi:ATP-binding cassette subfamily F protein 3